jgi:hypothetical protein
MGFACVHVASATGANPAVGFFWCDDPEIDRPWAWCASCERRFVETNSDWNELARVAQFKFLCGGCWDEVKHLLYSSRG